MGSDNGAAAECLLICCCHNHRCLKIICKEGRRKKQWVLLCFFFLFFFSGATCLISGTKRRPQSFRKEEGSATQSGEVRGRAKVSRECSPGLHCHQWVETVAGEPTLVRLVLHSST